MTIFIRQNWQIKSQINKRKLGGGVFFFFFLKEHLEPNSRKDLRELALQFLLIGVWRPFHMYSHLPALVYAENLPSEGYLNAANRKAAKHLSCSKDRKKNEQGFFFSSP